MSDAMLRTADGYSLEGKWDVGDEVPVAAVVMCHPHPQNGGTMNAPLIRAVTRKLVAEGFAVLRFNFRGVGESEGTWSGGEEEIDDVEAAFREVRREFADLPAMICGWSFGAVTALHWQAREGLGIPYAGIAPPVTTDLTPRLPDPAALPEGHRTFILGDRDQFVTVDELQSYADAVGADLRVIKGSDHFFHFRDQRVGELVVEALHPRG